MYAQKPAVLMSTLLPLGLIVGICATGSLLFVSKQFRQSHCFPYLFFLHFFSVSPLSSSPPLPQPLIIQDSPWREKEREGERERKGSQILPLSAKEEEGHKGTEEGGLLYLFLARFVVFFLFFLSLSLSVRVLHNAIVSARFCPESTRERARGASQGKEREKNGFFFFFSGKGGKLVLFGRSFSRRKLVQDH